MYAYVMRPETLPPSYWRFIVRTGPLDPFVLEQVRRNNRGLPVDVKGLLDFSNEKAGRVLTPPPITSEYPPMIPDILLHPHEPSLIRNLIPVFIGAAKMSFPLYLSLSFVPSVVLRFKQFVKNPLLAAYKAVAGAAQSTLFLALFPTIYQGVVSVHHNMVSTDMSNVTHTF